MKIGPNIITVVVGAQDTPEQMASKLASAAAAIIERARTIPGDGHVFKLWRSTLREKRSDGPVSNAQFLRAMNSLKGARAGAAVYLARRQQVAAWTLRVGRQGSYRAAWMEDDQSLLLVGLYSGETTEQQLREDVAATIEGVQ